MNKVTFTGWAAWAVVAVVLALAMFIGASIHAAVAPSTQYIECGTCGAHVSEWWYVQGADGTPCEVCEYCYQLFNE